MQSQEALKWCLHAKKKKKKNPTHLVPSVTRIESDITLPKSVTFMQIYRDFIVYDCIYIYTYIYLMHAKSRST
jgi:hypothetical protein